MKAWCWVVGLIAGISQAGAEPVTQQRISALPTEQQKAWQSYVEISQAAAAKDQAAMDEELRTHGMATPLRAPSGGDFKLPAKPGEAYFSSVEAQQLAEIILSYQTPSGGWSKHTGYSAGARKPGMLLSSQYLPGKRPHYLATFDNRSTTEQMNFLAYAWQATQREEYKAAFLRGLDFILSAQNPNGGWPQVYPLEGGYHDDVTFNDDAMTHVLELLLGIVTNEPYYGMVDAARREKVAASLHSGIDCVLKTQVEIEGKKTVWCAQVDPITLQPSNARAMEPATLSGGESVGILRFLMSLNQPSPEVVQAIESGLAWFEQAKVTGIKREKRDGKTVYVPDPTSTEVYWSRFYDLKTGKPVFPGRDGVLYDSFEALAAKNETGYDYYVTHPGSLLNTGQKKWRRLLQQPGAR